MTWATLIIGIVIGMVIRSAITALWRPSRPCEEDIGDAGTGDARIGVLRVDNTGESR